MQVTETLSEGLKHEFKISVPASDLDAKAGAKLVDLKDKVRINGFRPGKVPVAHLKKVYGRSVMAETIDQTIRDTNTQLFSERGFRLATEPKITMPSEQAEVEELLSGKTDLTYTVAIEVVPSIALADFKTFQVEKPVADVTDADVDEAIKRIADTNRGYAAKADGAKAESGDRVTINFKGTINGEVFEGGTGEGIQVVIGSNTFIPGFEEQLTGIGAGETRTLKVSFPKNYMNDKLAGQPAEFETTATSIEAPQDIAIDDEFAKTLGLESLDKLKEAARERLVAEFAGATRQRVKRALLDRLDEGASLRGAALARRRGVQSDVELGQGRDGLGRQDLCRRGHHRRCRQGRVPQDRRPPRAPRPRALRDRREEQDHRDRRRGRPRRDRAGPPDARPREGSLGLLPQQRPGAGPASCADL
ncbi:trigger factor [Bradyrhizobium diazoefficiens]